MRITESHNVVRCDSSSLRCGRAWMLGHKPNDVCQEYNSEGWLTRIKQNVLDKAQITNIEQNDVLLSTLPPKAFPLYGEFDSPTSPPMTINRNASGKRLAFLRLNRFSGRCKLCLPLISPSIWGNFMRPVRS